MNLNTDLQGNYNLYLQSLRPHNTKRAHEADSNAQTKNERAKPRRKHLVRAPTPDSRTHRYFVSSLQIRAPAPGSYNCSKFVGSLWFVRPPLVRTPWFMNQNERTSAHDPSRMTQSAQFVRLLLVRSPDSWFARSP